MWRFVASNFRVAIAVECGGVDVDDMERFSLPALRRSCTSFVVVTERAFV